MSLYEEWLKEAYNSKGEAEKKLWDVYIPLEQKIYQNMLENKIEVISGTVKELAARFHMSVQFVCGFLDGLNDAVEIPVDMEKILPDDYITMKVDYEKLYRKMVEYKAEHLYTLKEWEFIFTKEQQKEMYFNQKKQHTYIREEKINRNSPCPCGSGKNTRNVVVLIDNYL